MKVNEDNWEIEGNSIRERLETGKGLWYRICLRGMGDTWMLLGYTVKKIYFHKEEKWKWWNEGCEEISWYWGTEYFWLDIAAYRAFREDIMNLSPFVAACWWLLHKTHIICLVGLSWEYSKPRQNEDHCFWEEGMYFKS